MSEGIGQRSPAPPIIPKTQSQTPSSAPQPPGHAKVTSRLSMVPPRIITPASTAAPSPSSSSASASKPTTATMAAARTISGARDRDLSPQGHQRRQSRSPRRHGPPAVASSSASTSPPDRLAGLSSQRQLRQLERLAIQQGQRHHAGQHTSISPVAAGKRPAFEDQSDAHADVTPDIDAPDAKLSSGLSSQQMGARVARVPPATYNTRRGRSANVSPSRRWDRRGASATVLSGASASGSGSGEESEITVGPSHQRRLAGAVSNRSSLPRTNTSTRRSRGRGGASAKMSPDIAAQVDDEDGDGLTSSDEEGASASRYARSRRASLERDRLRGMQILMSASGGSKSGGMSSEDLLQLASYDVAAASASTSTSATPTTLTDDGSERSSMLSRTSSLDASPVTSPVVAPSQVLPSHSGSRKSRSRLNSTEAGSPAFFGLADDEEDEPISATLSASALSAALSARSRPRSQSRHASVSPAPSLDKVRSVPSSRRPSQPESATLGPATSSSVPNRASAILGFAPVSSSSSAAARFGTVPRQNARRQPSVMLSLSRSLGGSGSVIASDEIDLLSGSSIGSVEDLIQVDQVEWAPDADEGSDGSRARRGSLIGVRNEEAQRTGTGDATVAAIEAKSLMASSESEAEPGSSSRVATPSPSSRRSLSMLPKTPTAANFALLSKSSSSPSKSPEQESQAGFAVAYQERLSNLQSQLRLWASDSNAANGPPSSSSAEQQQQQQQQQQHQAGLLASSWRQIARLPNLLFPAAKADKSVPVDVAAAAASRSPSPSLADTSSSTSATPLPSAESSGITIGATGSSDAVAVHPSRRPSVGSRGVVDPFEGDRDPGAYVTGLGHRIDPDVELSSVVHLQSFRSRGRSVDGRRPSALRSSHHAAHAERRTSSDTEQSPALLSTKEGSLSSNETVSWEDATAHTSVLSALDLPPAVKPLTRAKPHFTLHDDEDDHELPDSTTPAAAAAAVSPVSSHHDDTNRTAKASAEVDDDGFTKVPGRRQSSSPRCSRPAAEAPVPMDWTAYGRGGSNSTSSEESDADLSRGNTTATTAESSDDSGHRTIGRRGRAIGDGEAGAEEEDAEDAEDRLAPARGRRGRGRGKGARISSRGNSPPTSARRDRQCAIGLFSSKPGSRRDNNSSDEYAAAAMKTVRSSPDLTYAGAAALGRGVSAADTRSRSRNGGAKPQRPSRSRTTSSSSLKGGRDAGAGEDTSSSSSDDGGRGRGRGRAGSVKVTSSSFAASEHPPNSLPRSASASNLETMARRQSMMSAAALSTGTSGGPPPMPMSSAQPSPPATTAHGGLMSSSWAYSGANGASGPSAAGRSSSVPGASSMAGKSNGSDAASSSSSGTSPNGASDAQQPLPLTPARPTLLSNSAHLLMLSLELEMMRAQKISAPLKVRWARQRAATAPAKHQATSAHAATQQTTIEEQHQSGVMASPTEAALEAAATDGPAPELVCASSSEDDEGPVGEDDSSSSKVVVEHVAAPALHRYAFQPRQASKLRHFTTG